MNIVFRIFLPLATLASSSRSAASYTNNNRSIARTAGSLILSSGGTIRAISNWGISSLPKRTRKHQAIYREGHYFIMRYDASSAVQDNVRKTLGLDPRMIKFSSVKLGDGTLESLSKFGAKIPWAERETR
jgi:small subunit ribosomal protein S6